MWDGFQFKKLLNTGVTSTITRKGNKRSKAHNFATSGKKYNGKISQEKNVKWEAEKNE